MMAQVLPHKKYPHFINLIVPIKQSMKKYLDPSVFCIGSCGIQFEKDKEGHTRKEKERHTRDNRMTKYVR